MLTKRCSKCGETKPASEFGKHTRSKDGLRYWCRTCYVESQRKYREVHREAVVDCNRRYREANKEVMAERNRKWRESNREYCAVRSQCRRARRTGNGVWYPKEHMEATWEAFGKECAYCKDTVGPFHLDHFVPVSKGGPTTIGNMVVACEYCNLSKHNKLPQDWLAPEKYIKIRDILISLANRV